MKDFTLIITSIIVMVGLGAVLGFGLSFAYRRLKVEEDPQLKSILGTLPGLNCGACGYASCEDFARNLMENKAPVEACKAGGTKVVEQLVKILGKKEPVEKKTEKARLKCNARDSQKTKTVIYSGAENCLAASKLGTSGFACFEGCLGFGDCAAVCPVSAISIEEGRPEISLSECIGCGLCVKACPRNLIDLVSLKDSVEKLVVVGCSCTQSGAVTRKICKVGCIACGICVKACAVDAISIENSKALIDVSKCVSCGKCVEVCPTKAIYVVEFREQRAEDKVQSTSKDSGNPQSAGTG